MTVSVAGNGIMLLTLFYVIPIQAVHCTTGITYQDVDKVQLPFWEALVSVSSTPIVLHSTQKGRWNIFHIPPFHQTLICEFHRIQIHMLHILEDCHPSAQE